MHETVSRVTAEDDGFQHRFLKAIFLYHTADNQGYVENELNLSSYGKINKIIFASPGYHSRGSSLVANVPEGPYFLAIGTGALYQAFRLYPDHQLAFTEAALQPTIPANRHTSQLRLGIKDIFELAGLRTSGGNRAFYNLYPPRNRTAPAIQRLIDAGAIVFENGDNPTADWVDFHCPFNPRGDGYQSPGGSSSGPAAGIASYEWLDIAVGRDTGGSMRNPAGLQGICGNRPSTGAVTMEGVLSLCDVLDTGRGTVLHAWYQNSERASKGCPRTGALLEEVVAGIEGLLQARREVVDTPSRWEETYPSGAPSNIIELLNTTYAILTSVHQYKNLALPIFTDYAAEHDGRHPYINPGPRVRWAWSQENGGDPGYEMALRNKTIFKDCAPTEPPIGFKDGRIATMAGVPDVVVPVGEVSYASTVSLRTEYMAVTMDLMLANLVRDLEKAGILKAVGTGSRMYD
ncbi:glutamyl-tRNA(Gln) amidotransferase, subunit A [Aspergillus novofumigatus IBT 16806]|uniref:Amidase signature enzyme n=1 Tax=Aspergillus novofumigatus (strain IBT 16806) TaxID=1392255 RepID=A0A2I1BYS9_ASPN1|nr:amidase signature enzyme [Aspergillus novofumigatus IBT 16806]PKX90528.1 amidase signature enzyme [Aspergillus novofumigatus IBT 16806]